MSPLPRKRAPRRPAPRATGRDRVPFKAGRPPRRARRAGPGGKAGPVRVGRYVMFDATFTVYLTAGGDSGGYFEWREDGFILVDVASNDVWAKVVANALHEVMEVGFVLRRCHYTPYSALKNDAVDAFLFVARHHEFTEICQHAGDALSYMLPDLAEAWKKVQAGR